MTTPVTDLQMCADCFTGAIHTATPRGHMDVIHDLPSYITRGNAASNSTIIFLTDGFGFNLVNNKLLADQYATKTGFRVLMPKVLPKGGVPLAVISLTKTMRTRVAWWDMQGQAKRAWAAVRLMAIVMPFTVKVKRLYPTVLLYVRAVKTSLPLGARLGIAGFCLGGHWSSRICAEAATDGGDSHLIGAHFTAHPLSLKAEDFAMLATRFRVPVSLALGDQDRMLPVAEAYEVEASLREVFRDDPDRLQVCIHERCGHGFALRADPHATDENEGADRALAQAVAWFRKYLA